MYDDDREKAQAILDRFDSIETADGRRRGRGRYRERRRR